MHSRLYLRVLSGNPWVHHCGAINNMYNDTGLVGIMATCESGQSDDMVGLLVKEFQVGPQHAQIRISAISFCPLPLSIVY